MGTLGNAVRGSVRRQVILVMVLGALVYLFFLAKFQANVWIYVDNGSDQPMQVSLDGSEKLVVAPHQLGIVRTHWGKKQITVHQGGGVIFDRTDELAYGSRTCYVLDPGMKHRYFIREVTYGHDTYHYSHKNVDNGYASLASEVTLVPAAEWVAVQKDYYVLEKPPDKVEGSSYTHEARRYVIERIDQADYDVIAAAKAKPSQPPYGPDFDKLEAAVLRTLRLR